MNKHDYNPAIAKIPMPDSIRALPVDPVRGFPVPWFVSWLHGKPEFRIADGRKLTQAIHERLCWVCGTKLNNRVSFPIGSMCSINRTTAEPPCHPACAEYSVRACPFLSRPDMVRRECNMPAEAAEATHSGEMILRNPGVTCIWTAKAPGAKLFNDGKGGILFELIAPVAVSWWCEGREATRDEVLHSIETGLPILREMAEVEGPEAIEHLKRLYMDAQHYWPRAEREQAQA